MAILFLVIRVVVYSVSMISCISGNTAQLLSFERIHHQFENIDGVSTYQIKTKGLSKVDTLTLNGSTVAKSHPIVIIDKITVPQIYHIHKFLLKKKELFKNLVLADPTFHISSALKCWQVLNCLAKYSNNWKPSNLQEKPTSGHELCVWIHHH